MTNGEIEHPGTSGRWVLLRDLGVLQVKLLVDGLRDLLLIPASMIAATMSLVSSSGDQPGSQFYRLLAWGKESEVWINLFGAMKNSPEEFSPSQSFGNHDMDVFVGRLESFIVDEARRGGVTSQAKDRLEKLLDALQRKKDDPAPDDSSSDAPP